VEDENLINVLCEIISKILGPFNYRDINSNENKSFLLEGLTHYNPQIRLLSIQQVYKCLDSVEFINDMVLYKKKILFFLN
jgi:26S proteasome non-ATPase regulatory subunit 5